MVLSKASNNTSLFRRVQSQGRIFTSRFGPLLLSLVFSLGLCWLILSEIHTYTYVWQSTTFASWIRPVRRHTCVLPESGIDKVEGKGKKYRIGVVVLYLDSPNHSEDASSFLGSLVQASQTSHDSSWNGRLMSKVINNRLEYCNRHGYELINANEIIDHSRPAAWSKLKAVEKALRSGRFDYVMYIDMDAIIMNLDIPIEAFISAGNSGMRDKENDESSHQEHPPYDLIMTGDWNGPNTGVWLIRNSEWSLWFLTTLWDQTHLLNEKSPDGIAYPFEYEQRAFHFLMNTKVWQKRQLPTYRGDSQKICDHISMVLPQCSFNSYSLHPLDYRGDREKAQYVPGDFIIHFAGKKGRKKEALMSHYLDQAHMTG